MQMNQTLHPGGILSDADKAALQGDQLWESSRFGALEKFILDFLVGGASAGESVRLKLQSPLYVTEALLDAAGQQLSEDLTAAQEVNTLSNDDTTSDPLSSIFSEKLACFGNPKPCRQ